MIESKDFQEALLQLEFFYHCPMCISKHTMTVNMYKHKKGLGTEMVDICHDCGEIFEIKDKI